jgi:hypothetical protein
MRNWSALPAFFGLDLSESYILSWCRLEDSLRIEADLVITPDHPKFKAPPPHERACFSRGAVVFPNVRSIEGLRPMSEVRPAIDALGEKDYGHFDSLVEVTPGTFEVSADFGELTIESGPPNVDISE